MDREHAKRVYEAAAEFHELSTSRAANPTDVRIAGAVVVALRTVFNRPQGWYVTELREALKKRVTPRLTHDELLTVMDEVYALIPAREDSSPEVQRIQASRPPDRKSPK